MRQRSLLFLISFGITSMASSQTVTVDPVAAAPDNSTTFNSLQMAIHSFQSIGATTAASPGGVGVNHGNVDADVINVLNTGVIDEVLRIDERPASLGYAILDEGLTISGPGNGVEPSLVNNAIVAVQDDGANDDDGFEIRTDVDMTINNMTFIPSPTTPFSDDLVTIDRVNPSNGTINTVTFKGCVLTTYNEAGLPVVNSKAEGLVDQSALVATPDTSLDDFFTPFPDANEGMTVNFIDSVMSQNKALLGNRDSIVEIANTPRTDPFIFNIVSSVISYSSRYGIQLSGYGDATDYHLWTCNITGDNVGDGPVNGEGGPTVILGHARGIQSFIGPEYGALNMSDTLITDCSERGASLNANAETSMTKVIIDTPVPVVATFGALSHDATWRDVTLRADGASSLLGNQAGSAATLTIRDSIFAGDGAVTNALAPFDIGDMQINVDYSGVVTEGPNSVTALGGTSSTTIGSNIVNSDPLFAGLDPLLATYLDVANCDYEAKEEAGGDLSGGADFIGVCANVADWSMY